MKLLSYDSFKKLVMDTTHPRRGKKVAFLIQECHERRLPQLRPLESMKGVRMFIVYRESESSNAVLELKNLDEFGQAQTYAAYHSWPFVAFRDCALMINFGHSDLSVLVDYRPNRARLADFLKTVRPEPNENYSGRPIREMATA